MTGVSICSQHPLSFSWSVSQEWELTIHWLINNFLITSTHYLPKITSSHIDRDDCTCGAKQTPQISHIETATSQYNINYSSSDCRSDFLYDANTETILLWALLRCSVGLSCALAPWYPVINQLEINKYIRTLCTVAFPEGFGRGTPLFML